MKLLRIGDKAYRPLLNKDGKLNVRTAVAYGNKGEGMFVMTVYVMCVPQNAGVKGGNVEDQSYDIRAYREIIPNTTTHAEQYSKLQFMLNIVATRLECDYELRLPIETRKTPKYAKEKTDGIQRLIA